ncbi:MAG: choice-of-anchor L domain-containing protein [Myxococcales bacterium]|nr:choice-of-anchor L domain-containing protein [Myxococcales bacterium]
MLTLAWIAGAGCSDDMTSIPTDSGDPSMTTTGTSAGPSSSPTSSTSPDTSSLTTTSTSSTSTSSTTPTSASTSSSATLDTETSSASDRPPDVGENTTGSDDCQAPGLYTACDDLESDDWVPVDPNTAPFYALGLGCPGATPADGIPIFAHSFHSVDANAWRVAAAFGTHEISPGVRQFSARPAYKLDGNGQPTQQVLMPSHAFLMLSTGRIAALTGSKAVVESFDSQAENGDNSNDDGDQPPAPIVPNKGSNGGLGGDAFHDCDGVGDCSDTLADQWALGGADPNDKIWLQFQTIVPPETLGYRFDFAFFSSEWPMFVGTGYNDLFIAWQVSEAYTGNTTFLPDPENPGEGLPLTITALDEYIQSEGFACLPANDPGCQPPAELESTGFERRAGTDWVTAEAAVTPGETVEVALFLADMSDSLLATLVLLDNFRWDCEGCVPTAADDCGVILD